VCYEPTDRPPIAPMAGGSVETEELELVAADGNRLSAFAARTGDRPSPHAVLILPDVRGLHPFYISLAERFAEAGVDALAIDYFGRTAGVGHRDDSFDYMQHTVQATWAGLSADITAGARALATPPGRPVYTVGFCFGGRASFLSDGLAGITGVVGFYGPPGPTTRYAVPAPIESVGGFHGPVLGLFGGADQGIPADQVEAFDAALQAAGVPHELVTYPDAPHSFFDRKATDYAAASVDAWRRILAFVGAPGAAAESRA